MCTMNIMQNCKQNRNILKSAIISSPPGVRENPGQVRFRCVLMATKWWQQFSFVSVCTLYIGFRWLRGLVARTSNVRRSVVGSNPGHDTAWLFLSGISSSSRNEYYLGGIIALLLQGHRTMSIESVCSSQYRWRQISTERLNRLWRVNYGM